MWEVYFTEAAERWLMELDDVRHHHRGGRSPRGAWPGARPSDRGQHQGLAASQHEGAARRALRALFVFDPGRRAVVLIGGDKGGDRSAWYEQNVPMADDLYDAYLREASEG
jgi:hypothetical protein